MLPIGPTIGGKKLITPRACGKCKRKHTHVPPTSPFKSGLFWWDCICESTLTATEQMLDTAPNEPLKFKVGTGIPIPTQKKATAVVVDLNNVSHIISLPCWSPDYKTIRVMLNGKASTIKFVRLSKNAAYFKECETYG
jgi:hypothetical protein